MTHTLSTRRAATRLAALFVLALGALLGGCVSQARHLRMLPLNHAQVVSGDGQSADAVLLHDFDDLRGGAYSEVFPTTYIPAVNFFHLGWSIDYPEMSGDLVSSEGGRRVVTIGSLPAAMPYLLASMMREMRLTSDATPRAELNTRGDARRFAWQVRGRVLRTHVEAHANPIPLGALGVLGVPYVFVSYEAQYEVQLFRRDETQPTFTQRYQFSGRRAVGLYYNLSAYRDLFVEGLESTLPQVVQDLAVAMRRTDASPAPIAPSPTPEREPAPPVTVRHRRGGRER